MSHTRRASVCMLAIAFGLASQSANAQSADNPDDDQKASPEGLQEIIVTAEKRSISLQKTALSIQAFDGSQLENSGIQSVTQLSVSTPGLQVNRTGPNGFPFLRGLGTAINPIGADPSVAIYTDGLYRPRARDSLVQFLDVERVEVVKGPQGTLYGRNAVGGAINVISARPTNNFEGSFEAEYGNYDAYRLTGVLNLPLVDGKAAARFALRRAKRDGFARNIAPGAPSQLENQDVWQGRASLSVDPTDTLKVLLHASFYQDDTNGFAFRTLIPGFANFPRDVLGAVQPDNPRVVSNDFVNPSNIRSQTYGGELNWDVGGDTQIAVRGGYARSKAVESIDRDDTAVAFSYLSAADESDSYSAEAVVNTLAITGLAITAGASYFNEAATQFNTIGFGIPLFPPAVPAPGFIPGLVFADVSFDNTAYGVFSQATLDLTPNTRFTGGLRYSWEEKSYENESRVGIGAPPTAVPSFGDKDSWSRLTWLARLEHDLDSDKLVYASASTGFKSGGFNTAVSAKAPSFAPESILAFEAGAKTVWLDRRLRVNAAAFYYDYKDVQVQKNDPGALVNAIENAAKAEIYGLDFDASFQPVPALTIDLGYQWLQTKFKNYTAFNPYAPAGSGRFDLAGRDLTRAPRHSVSAAVSYRAEIGDDSSLTFRADANYRSDFWFRAFQQSFDRENGYAVVNARLTYAMLNEAISLSAFAQNLFDETYRINLGDPPSPDVPGNYYGAPRTYGIALAYRF